MSKQAHPINGSDMIAVSDAVTLWGLLRERVRRSPAAIAYRDYDRARAAWRDHSWETIFKRVERFRAALAKESLKPGDRIAILLPNGIDWVCLDMAAHGAGLVVVGLYPYDSADSNAYILGHSDARLAILDSKARWDSIWPLRSMFPALERVWLGDIDDKDIERGPANGPSGSPIREIADILADRSDPPAPHPVKPDEIATLIYTSGTTGRPKGVMLSHFALLWNAEATSRAIPLRVDDIFLSILPLAHVFERTAGYYLPMMVGCSVAYSRSRQDLPDDLRAVRPTVMLGVPLIFERICAAIQAKTAGSVVMQKLLQMTTDVGWRGFVAAQRGSRLAPGARLLWPALKRLVAAPVLAVFGGRLRVVFSGGAPLDQSVARMLIGLGLPIVEGYGLTETAPVVATNRLDDNLPGSVGRPLDGIEVKVTSQGELLVRSPSTMTGYWKDDERTKQTVDAEGWLATGDVAEITSDGRVVIRGRLKDVIVLSIGEKVNPNVVEAGITRDPLFKQALVVGNRRPFLISVVVLDTDTWSDFATAQGLDPRQPNDAVSKGHLLARISSLLTDLPRYAQVRAVHLILEPWTLEAGLLTPTLKIKRDRIVPLYTKDIEDLYAKP
jgi:long-chain acyl-CoA synthetase